MHFDAGRHGRARELCKEALFLSQMAGDRMTTARAVNTMSWQAIEHGRPREAVQFARLGAAHFPPSGPVAALLAAREARAWAALDNQEEAAAAVRRARNAFAAAGPAPEWASFFTEAELAGALARVDEDLGRWDAAEQAQRDCIADPTLPARAGASFRMCLVRILARRGDHSAARAEIEAALPELAVVSSGRVRSQVREVLRVLPMRSDLVGHRQQLEVFA